MDAFTPPSDMHAPAGFVMLPDKPCTEVLVDALKVALAAPGEHRLFRAGKLPGLFAARTGLAAEAALFALRDGLLETVRTETKAKIITEWVRATPMAVGFVHEHDTTRSILRELKEVLDATREGVPTFMAEARTELAALATNFEARASAMLTRLDDLAKRCEAALRRAEMRAPKVEKTVVRVVPWASEALDYLDKRIESGAAGDCPLPELFEAVCLHEPGLTLSAFHDGVKRLQDVRAVRLLPSKEMTEPEYAVVIDGTLMYAVGR